MGFSLTNVLSMASNAIFRVCVFLVSKLLAHILCFFFSVGVIFLLLICRGFFLYIVEMSPLLFFYIKNICLHFLSCVHVSFFRQKFSFFDVIIVFAVAFVFVDS